ncbi:stage II sporulation protein M [Oscillospiraceae bacterium LTW-04]|nr:stage II sporulation protein M [Oscillospiraceae bacterium MB24-C1]
MTFIIMEYQRAFKFLRRLLVSILLMLVVFFAVAITAHFVFSAQYQADPTKMEQQIMQLSEMFNEKDVINESGQLSVMGLFFNNFIASGMAVVTGVVPFIFVPLAALALNAVLVGIISAIMGTAGIGGPFELVVSIAPHGVFEIPALLISAAMGIALCLDISARVLYKKRDMSFLTLLAELARISVLVIVPLLAVAAVLEAYLTPALMAILL